MEKEAAENEIKLLQEKLKSPDITEKDKNTINTEIKKQETIRDQKKTLTQKVAQITLGVMGVAVAGGIAWTLWKPYPQRERDPNAMNVAELRQYLELMNAGMTSEEAMIKIKGKKISIEDFLKK